MSDNEEMRQKFFSDMADNEEMKFIVSGMIDRDLVIRWALEAKDNQIASLEAEIKELKEINHRLRTTLDLLRNMASSED